MNSDDRWVIEHLLEGSDQWFNTLAACRPGFTNRDMFSVLLGVEWMMSVKEELPSTAHLRLRNTITQETIPIEAL